MYECKGAVKNEKGGTVKWLKIGTSACCVVGNAMPVWPPNPSGLAASYEMLDISGKLPWWHSIEYPLVNPTLVGSKKGISEKFLRRLFSRPKHFSSEMLTHVRCTLYITYGLTDLKRTYMKFLACLIHIQLEVFEKAAAVTCMPA